MKNKNAVFQDVHLPILNTFAVLNGKWKLVILAVLVLEGEKCFTDLERQIGLSRTVLSKQLKELEMKELVYRRPYRGKPVRVEYSSTPYADTLKEVLAGLALWSKNQTGRSGEAGRILDASQRKEPGKKIKAVESPTYF